MATEVPGRRPVKVDAGDLLLTRTADGFRSNQGLRRNIMVVLLLATDYRSMAGGKVLRWRR
jgi:hypothetical protein